MNLIAPFGFFGAGNIGDESTLQGFARLVAEHNNRFPIRFHVWVASRNPSHTARVEPSFKYYGWRGSEYLKRWARFRSKAYIIPGGTPIMDILGKWPLSEICPLISGATRKRKPVIFMGSGVEGLQREDSRRAMAEIIAPVVRYWTVRCERDKQRLLSYGVASDRVTVASDMAWVLDAAQNDFGCRVLSELGVNVDDHLIGVNLTNEKFVNEQEPKLFDKVAQFLDLLVEERNAKILFFTNEVRDDEAFDKTANTKALTRMKHQERALLMPNKYRTPQERLSVISCLTMTVSMRYHFCLFSAMQGVPFIAIKRSDKVDDLCWDMEWPYGISLPDMDTALLLKMATEIEDNKALVSERMQRKVQSMRKRALMNLAALDAIALKESA